MRWTETPFVLALAAAFVVGWFAVGVPGFWLLGRFVRGWFAGWFGRWLVGWLVGWLAGRLGLGWLVFFLAHLTAPQ